MILHNKSELVANIWFIVSIDSSFACEWMIRPYCLQGTDEEKFKILKLLAETDYYTAKRYRIPKNYKWVVGSKSLEGVIHVSAIKNELETNIDYYISALEEDMPEMLLFPYDDDKRKFVKLKFEQSPLFVETILMENYNGELRPYTTQENINWYNKEKEKQAGFDI